MESFDSEHKEESKLSRKIKESPFMVAGQFIYFFSFESVGTVTGI